MANQELAVICLTLYEFLPRINSEVLWSCSLRPYNKSEGFNKNVLIFLRRIFYYYSLMYGYFLDASVLLSQGHLHSDRAYKGFSRSR